MGESWEQETTRGREKKNVVSPSLFSHNLEALLMARDSKKKRQKEEHRGKAPAGLVKYLRWVIPI